MANLMFSGRVAIVTGSGGGKMFENSSIQTIKLIINNKSRSW